MNFTAGQVIHRSIRNFPDLYGGSHGIKADAEHIMCVIGGGGDWHPNGFVLYDPDMSPDEPEIPIPVFNDFYSWYPLSEYSSLMIAAGVGGDNVPKLNPSFRDLAFNVARCMVKWGVRPCADARPKEAARNAKQAIDNWQKAGQVLQGLAKQYPGNVPPDCAILAKPCIEQANWVLQALHTPCWFEWRGKKKNLLWIVNDQCARRVKFRTFKHNQTRELDFNYSKFGYGRRQQARQWSNLICELACWIMGEPHRGFESAMTPASRVNFWAFVMGNINELLDSPLMDRLKQTSYRAVSTDWHEAGKNERGRTLYSLSWYPPWTQKSFDEIAERYWCRD